MELIIHGDKLKITDSMHEYIEKKLGKLEKYLENNEEVRATVIVKVKNHEQRVEITIPLKAFILRSEEAQEDFYAAVDKTIDKLERQLKKNKSRIMSKKIKNAYDFSLPNFEVEEEEVPESKILKRKKVEVKPMNEEEAILQMELLGHQFYMYKDSETLKYAVIYKRNDGNYGLIESE